MALIVKLDPDRPREAFSRCREVIAAGGVLAFPTDTFYGLGVDPRNGRAVEKLFAIKGRSPDQPILLLIDDAARAPEWAADVPARAAELMRRFWPGPLTIIFTATERALPLLTGGTNSLGLRVPGNPATRGLLRFLGHALTGTSANRSGGPDGRTAREVEAALGDRIDLILDGGETAGGRPSTVVDVRSGGLRVLREGAIPLQELERRAAEGAKSKE